MQIRTTPELKRRINEALYQLQNKSSFHQKIRKNTKAKLQMCWQIIGAQAQLLWNIKLR